MSDIATVSMLVLIVGGGFTYYWFSRRDTEDAVKKPGSEGLRQKPTRNREDSKADSDSRRFGRQKASAKAGFGRR